MQPFFLIIKSHKLAETKTGHFLIDYQQKMDAEAPFVDSPMYKVDRQNLLTFGPRIFIPDTYCSKVIYRYFLICNMQYAICNMQYAGVQNIKIHAVNIS
jgi:hypothetical protein